MTRAQFYKLRPKMPKITKADPRRQYASEFVEAFNSADFDVIWEFISTHSATDCVFVHRWEGKDQYLTFPTLLSLRGWENIAEYWFSRCVIAPDFVVQLKEAKLYVRSDGYSTVLGSFTINCTRLYDGLLTHSLIVQTAEAKAEAEAEGTVESNEGKPMNVKMEETDSHSSTTNPNTSQTSEEAKAEVISDRVMERLDQILLNCAPLKEKKKLSGKRKKRDEVNEPITPSTVKSEGNSKVEKVIPSGTGITLLGTITMQLNQEMKVKHYDMTFALKQ